MEEKIKKKLLWVISLFVLLIILLFSLLYAVQHFNKKEEIVSKPVEEEVEEIIEEPVIEEVEKVEEEVVVEKVIDTKSDSSINKIVNKENLVDKDYVPSLQTIENTDIKLRDEAKEAFEQMSNKAKEEGIDIVPLSGYRDYKEQLSLYYTYEEKYGRKYADRLDATPGASEHQLGLAIDVGDGSNKCNLQYCFINTAAGKWLKENSYKYGFILRYPYGKEDVTKVIASPWHYRYIGIEEAKNVFDSNLVLEEYYTNK